MPDTEFLGLVVVCGSHECLSKIVKSGPNIQWLGSSSARFKSPLREKAQGSKAQPLNATPNGTPPWLPLIPSLTTVAKGSQGIPGILDWGICASGCVPPPLAEKRVDKATQRSNRTAIFFLHRREISVLAGGDLHHVPDRTEVWRKHDHDE